MQGKMRERQIGFLLTFAIDGQPSTNINAQHWLQHHFFFNVQQNQ